MITNLPTRVLTYNDEGIVCLPDGTTQWGADYQPFAQSGIIIQYHRYIGGHISAEAVIEATGELVGSACHPALTYDQVRRYLATR